MVLMVVQTLFLMDKNRLTKYFFKKKKKKLISGISCGYILPFYDTFSNKSYWAFEVYLIMPSKPD